MRLKDLIPEGILPAAEDDAIAFLRAEHDRVEDLFASFDEIKYGRADADKQRVVGEICRELRLHSAVEEEIFYPAVRAEIADDDLMNEATVEHDGIERLVADLEAMAPEDDMVNAKMHVLDAYVTHHVREEEENIFPKARECAIDLLALAAKMARKRAKLVQAGAAKADSTARKPRARTTPGEPRAHR